MLININVKKIYKKILPIVVFLQVLIGSGDYYPTVPRLIFAGINVILLSINALLFIKWYGD